MAWATALSIINDAAVEIGLGPVSDAFGSTDPNITQLRQFLKSCGQEMVHMKQWTHLRGEYTFTTVQGQANYPLPADWHNMIDQTGWNRTTRLPVGGPLSPQEWQFLKSRLVGVTWTLLFRPMLQQIYLFPDTNTPGGHQIAFEYLSKNWVGLNGNASANSDAPANNGDIIYFDNLMMMRFIKMQFLRAKGLDQTAAEDEFTKTFKRVAGDDSPAPVLGVTHRPLKNEFLGEKNVPITGWGS